MLQPGDESALETFLAREPDSSSFLRSNLRHAGLVDGPCVGQASYAAAFEGDDIVGVASHCWNHSMLLQAPLHVEQLARHLVGTTRRPVAGILGPRPQVEKARAVMGLVGAATAIDSTDILYGLDLDHLILPPRLQEKGVICRRSGIADLDLLKEWRVAFSIEALGYRDSPALHESSSELVDALHAQGDLWLLTESGRPVASAAINARLADSVTVGGVWAPPDLRGRGYARAVVGGMLEEARRSGVPRSVLFADRANPFSCRAYEALGFQAVGDYGLILFHEPHSTGVE